MSGKETGTIVSNDPKDTQPYSHGADENNRSYVPAVWESGAGPGGSPKVSGGYEQSKTNGPIATRGFNRRDQRYLQDEATLQANRDARATAEASGTIVLQGALGLIELRSPSGNNYDLAGDASTCDCPDMWRLTQSGKTGVACKHRVIAAGALMVAGGYTGLPWSTARAAEFIGIDERTVQQLCHNGTIPATKFNGNWVINPDTTTMTAITDYTMRLIMQDHKPEPPP